MGGRPQSSPAGPKAAQRSQVQRMQAEAKRGESRAFKAKGIFLILDTPVKRNVRPLKNNGSPYPYSYLGPFLYLMFKERRPCVQMQTTTLREKKVQAGTTFL